MANVVKQVAIFPTVITEFEDAANYYKSSGYGDELVWAAAWIYYASSDKWYLQDG